jgi:hypothetical protein
VRVPAGQVVSDAVRKRVQARQEQLQAAEAVAPLSEVQIGLMKGQMAALMEEGESVMKALKRLGAGRQSTKGAPQPTLCAASTSAPLLRRHHTQRSTAQHRRSSSLASAPPVLSCSLQL